MKKMLCGVIVIAAIMFFGCSKPAPEEVAKEYVKKQFVSDHRVKFHTSTLTYKIVKEDENSVTVNVSGNIYYEEDIKLVKDGNKWVLKSDAARTEAVPAKTEAKTEAETEAETAAETAAGQ